MGNNTKLYKSVAKDIIVVGLYLLSCLQESFVTDCGRVVADLRERYILRCRSRKRRHLFLVEYEGKKKRRWEMIDSRGVLFLK